MRLAFSVAVNVDPDILIIDEVLGVGDVGFQAKCYDRIEQFKRDGKSLFFVSHSQQLVRKFCDRTLWLDHGEAVLLGAPDEVLNAYAGASM
jgi:ABC-type polysaccharide/polyol phosphate transport system ATPase subunit